MADDSPGKVQALRAIFSENNKPVMGMMPPTEKIGTRPWRTSSVDAPILKERKFSELKLRNKVLPVPENPPSSFNGEDVNDDKPSRSVCKPTVGPKPSYLSQYQRTVSARSSESGNSQSVAQSSDNTRPKIASAGQAKSRAFGETIASFMFASDKENDDCAVSAPPPPIPKPRNSIRLQNHVDIMNLCNSQGSMQSRCCSIVSSDNYISKGKVKRKEIPAPEKLGPAPVKPTRPPHLKLPLSSCQKLGPLRPLYPCPPRPLTPPPLPPISAPVIQSLREEIEELYEDTLLRGSEQQLHSPIPEFTEEEEQAEELYHDAADGIEESFSDSLKCKKPPPPVPSEYLQPNIHSSDEELYQDADGCTQEEFYEVMPCHEISEDSGSPLYSNSKKEIEKLKREEEKRMRKEQKEKDKREKELEKLKKKFGLTGEEVPIDDGLVKWDSRGGRGDLPVKRGETVLILRMEGNPSGKWLVKNEKGKIGYVELTNIEVDPLSVKSVMSIQRMSVISTGEELYNEAKSEEAIYEVTY